MAPPVAIGRPVPEAASGRGSPAWMEPYAS